MFSFLRRRRAPCPDPPVYYDHRYAARFTCTRPWERAAVHECFRHALDRHRELTEARITAWDGHAVTARFTLTLPWTGPGPDGASQAAGRMTDLITLMPIGHRLLHLARSGAPRLAWTNWSEMAAHPVIAELDALASAYYEPCNE